MTGAAPTGHSSSTGPHRPQPGTPIPVPAAADDLGAADPRLAAALAAGDAAAVREALPGARLIVAVVAMPGEDRASDGEMALALVETPSGARALPAFTDIDALARWQPAARPVPRPAAAVLAHVLSDGLGALLLDPAGPHPWTVEADEVAWLTGTDGTDASQPTDEPSQAPGDRPDPADAAVTAPSWRPRRRLRKELDGLDAWALDVGGEPVVAVVLPQGADGEDLARRVAEAAGGQVDLLVLDEARGRIVDAIGRRLGNAG